MSSLAARVVGVPAAEKAAAEKAAAEEEEAAEEEAAAAAAGLVGEWMWAARRASRERRILSVLGVYKGSGTASAEGDAAPVSCGAMAAGSGAGLLQVAPEGSTAAVGWSPKLDNDDDTHCSGGAERVVLGESEASASLGSRVEGIAGG